MKLDLNRVWEICNTLSEKQSELAEESVYIHLLGHQSDYSNSTFENFLEYYSFKIDGDDIVVFNDDFVEWEDYRTNDFSSFPLSLLSFDEKSLNIWIKNEMEMQLKQQEINKIAEKENIKQKIEFLQKQLNS
jgi:hypothetical protein